MTAAEQSWLATMINQDTKEEYEERLNFIEYLASFINPEAVEHVVNERENAKKYLGDKDFAKMLEGTFGRKPKFQEKNN